MTLGMSSTIVVNAQPQEETCAVCHAALGVEQLTKPVELYKADIHAAKGFGCVACHGGDATQMGLEAMDRAEGLHRQAHPDPSDSGLRPLPFRRGFYEAIQSLSKSRSGHGILHFGSWEATQRTQRSEGCDLR